MTKQEILDKMKVDLELREPEIRQVLHHLLPAQKKHHRINKGKKKTPLQEIFSCL